MQAVLVAFTGYGVHDINLCKERGVKVYNVPDYSSSSVAELDWFNVSSLREILKATKSCVVVDGHSVPVAMICVAKLLV